MRPSSSWDGSYVDHRVVAPYTPSYSVDARCFCFGLELILFKVLLLILAPPNLDLVFVELLLVDGVLENLT